MSPGRRPVGAILLAAVVAVTGCTDKVGVDGVVGGPLPTEAAAPGVTTTTTAALSPTSTGGPGSTAVLPTVPSSTSAAPAPPATAVPGPGRLLLGGADLGVTRVGAPIGEAVAAVSAALGSPVGNPAPDTSCIGAEEETSWEAFRLASSGDKVSGWLSTSRALATPAGVTVGTPLPALRQAYGPRLQVRPPPEPDIPPGFVVDGAGIAGTLTGQAPTDTVASLFNGTCEAA